MWQAARAANASTVTGLVSTMSNLYTPRIPDVCWRTGLILRGSPTEHGVGASPVFTTVELGSTPAPAAPSWSTPAAAGCGCVEPSCTLSWWRSAAIADAVVGVLCSPAGAGDAAADRPCALGTAPALRTSLTRPRNWSWWVAEPHSHVDGGTMRHRPALWPPLGSTTSRTNATRPMAHCDGVG